MMRPFRVVIDESAAEVQFTEPKKFTSITRRTTLGSVSAKRLRWLMPALLIKTSIPPQVEHTRSIAASASADTLQVGPGKTYSLPSQAATAANDGDVIEIDAGDYSGDVAFWTQNSLTIRGVGGRAHLAAAGNHAGGKAIWVIQGDDTVIESIEFSDAVVPDDNGAGIRQEGTNLTVRDCYFHDARGVRRDYLERRATGQLGAAALAPGPAQPLQGLARPLSRRAARGAWRRGTEKARHPHGRQLAFGPL